MQWHTIVPCCSVKHSTTAVLTSVRIGLRNGLMGMTDATPVTSFKVRTMVMCAVQRLRHVAARCTSMRAMLMSQCAQCGTGRNEVSDVTLVTSSNVRTIVMRMKHDGEREIA